MDADAELDTSERTLVPDVSDQADPSAQAEQVLDVAATLFATRGPKTITLKWVARDSGAPVDWIASRWPTIDDLLAAVLARGAERTSAASPVVPTIDGQDFTEAAEALFDLHDRVIVRAILDGYELTALMASFPMLDRLVADLISSGLEESVARGRALQIVVLELGWRFFGADMLAACQLEGDAAIDATAQVRALQQRLTQPSPLL